MKFSADPVTYLKKVESLVFGGRHQAALEMIEQIDNLEVDSSNILRLKSYAQLGVGDVDGSFATLQDVVASDDCLVDDIFAAGERAIELCRYADAEAYLTDVLEKQREAKDEYYTQTCLLMRAYARIRMRKFALAKEDIDGIEEETEVDWLTSAGLITKRSLLNSISNPDGN